LRQYLFGMHDQRVAGLIDDGGRDIGRADRQVVGGFPLVDRHIDGVAGEALKVRVRNEIAEEVGVGDRTGD
jgi:hypothetical protein